MIQKYEAGGKKMEVRDQKSERRSLKLEVKLLADKIFGVENLSSYFVFRKSGFIMILPFLFIAPTESMGRGVFTSQNIEPGTIVEISPVIKMSAEERLLLDKTKLHDYIFEWGRDEQQCCMALGYVAVYNHSYKSNCEYEMNFEHENISIRAVRQIMAGEELFINYNGDWNDIKSVWFETK